jgi:hypothetical protein
MSADQSGEPAQRYDAVLPVGTTQGRVVIGLIHGPGPRRGLARPPGPGLLRLPWWFVGRGAIFTHR